MFSTVNAYITAAVSKSLLPAGAFAAGYLASKFGLVGMAVSWLSP